MGKAHNKTYFINRNMHGFVESSAASEMEPISVVEESANCYVSLESTFRVST